MPDYQIPVYPASATFEHTPVDLFGTFSFAMDTKGWPQLIAGHELYSGKCDHEAYAECVNEAATKRPVLSSCIAAVGPPWNQKLVWRHQPRAFKAEVLDLSGEALPPEDEMEEWLHEKTGLDDWEPDLTVDFPLRVIISKLAEDRHVVSSALHHAWGDVGSITPFWFDVNSSYDKLILGSKSIYATQTVALGKIELPPAAPTIPYREYVRIMMKEEREYPRSAVAQTVGTPGTPRRTAAMKRIEEDMITELRSRARSLDGTLTDLTVAASKLAVAEWNTARDQPPQVQRHNVAVAQRGRSETDWDDTSGTQTSLVTVCTKAGDWDDPEKLLTQIANVRKERMAQGADIIFQGLGKKLLKGLSVLPVNRRLARIRRSVRRDQTLLLTNVHRPPPKNGEVARPQSRGEMVREGHYPMGLCMPQYPNSMSLLGGRQPGARLKISSNEGHMTRAELNEFHALVLAKMEAYAD